MLNNEERARIARENGAKSHGPTSAEGKEKVSQNPIKHGFYAKRMVIPGESEEVYALLAEAYVNLIQPQTLVEMDLAVDIINSRWLIRRAEHLTTTAYWAAQDKLVAQSEVSNYGSQTPDRLQYACFQQAIEGKNYLEILATMKEKHERGYHRALSRREHLRKRKEPLPQVNPNEVESQFPENSAPPAPKEPCSQAPPASQVEQQPSGAGFQPADRFPIGPKPQEHTKPSNNPSDDATSTIIEIKQANQRPPAAPSKCDLLAS